MTASSSSSTVDLTATVYEATKLREALYLLAQTLKRQNRHAESHQVTTMADVMQSAMKSKPDTAHVLLLNINGRLPLYFRHITCTSDVAACCAFTEGLHHAHHFASNEEALYMRGQDHFWSAFQEYIQQNAIDNCSLEAKPITLSKQRQEFGA